MCGIAGIFNYQGTPVSQELIERMTRTLAHRGPDGEGFYVEGPIGLGHRRLSVLDLSPAGAQPMASNDEKLWITYNGELYNFLEIRKDLEARGHRFRSRTDTEVILYAYKEWGRNCLTRFNGMFAFALWDVREQLLWLVRDRLGVKPLFYSIQPKGFVFASEIKGLLPALIEAPELNEEALHHFLSLNYTPAPLTLFQGVQQLLPAHEMICHRDGTIHISRYWNLHEQTLRLRSGQAADPSTSLRTGSRPFDFAQGRQHTEEDRRLEQRLAELLMDAVRLRLISDVEIGAFLSGGIDSSVIVALMQQERPLPIKTFTAAFRESSYNEAPQANDVARLLRTTHQETWIENTDLELLPRMVWHSEELTADSSMLAVYRLAERASQDVKVVLAGDGADELFGGYSTYLATQLSTVYRGLPNVLREGLIRPMINRLPVVDRKMSLESRLRRFVNADMSSTATIHASWRVIFSEQDKRLLLGSAKNWPSTASLYEPFLAGAGHHDLINRLLDADLCFYLPNDMLVKVDRMTMAWGLEARLPYLDFRIAEFAASLPSRVKYGMGLLGKSLLRRATRRFLPISIRNRRKEGFNIPVACWLKGKQRTFMERHLLDARPQLLSIFKRQEIERLVSQHIQGGADNSYKLWNLLCLSLWGQQFLKTPTLK